MAKNTANNLSLAHSSGLMSRLAYAHAKQAHANVAKLLKKSGLTLNDIDNVTIRIGAQKQIDFVELVAQTIGDSNLGFRLAREFDLRTIGLLYYVAASAKTLGDALQRAARCSATVNDGILLAIRQGRSLKVTFKYSGIARYTDRQQIAFWITALVRVAQHLTNRNVHPLRIRLVHHKPDTTGELKNFFRARIEGDCPVDMVEFAASTWTLPIVNADPYLHRLLLQVCEETLARRQLRGGPFRIRVENAIVELLPHGHAKVGNVAAKLHMSAKKLAQQLSAERLTFSKVLRELRETLARRYLADPDLSVSQIAWLLGYKETAAFTHAFRGWTRTSPRAARTRGYLRKFQGKTNNTWVPGAV